MKRHPDVLVAQVYCPFTREFDIDDHAHTQEDVTRGALMQALGSLQRGETAGWQPLVNDEGNIDLRVVRAYRQPQVELEPGDPLPEGYDAPEGDDGIAYGEPTDLFDDDAEEQEASITGGEKVTASSEGDELQDKVEALYDALQMYVEQDEQRRLGQQVTSSEADACHERGRAALELLDPDGANP